MKLLRVFLVLIDKRLKSRRTFIRQMRSIGLLVGPDTLNRTMLQKRTTQRPLDKSSAAGTAATMALAKSAAARLLERITSNSAETGTVRRPMRGQNRVLRMSEF